MPPRSTDTPTTVQRCTRVLLALVLVLTPWLTTLAAMPAAAAATASDAVPAMPCHGAADDAAAVAPAAPEACPHCAGDAPGIACDCCNEGAPSALAGKFAHTHFVFPGREPKPLAPSAAPPTAPRERLYRPPIAAV